MTKIYDTFGRSAQKNKGFTQKINAEAVSLHFIIPVYFATLEVGIHYQVEISVRFLVFSASSTQRW